ncbi:MAG: acetylxylan esterase [Candidatus Hydrogenedentes bacterium]|nr:acetylxylan esterase [Candidatus Hydrogenedentota bacterium]
MRLLALLCVCGFVAQAGELDVLDVTIDGQPASQMMSRYLDGKAAQVFDKRRAGFAQTIATQESIAAHQQAAKDFYTQTLGGWPERTPLNSRKTGEGEGDGYRYEKYIIETMPGVYVTGVLFLPVGVTAPFPGVIVPCGHSVDGKGSEAYQRLSIQLAKNGMAAFIYDPEGQGERYYFFRDDKKPRYGTTIHHTLVGTGAILTGTSTAMYFIWDGMRAIDFLQSRDDIIKDKIGCTGNSGGGTLTSYIMAMDERVACAAPSCYITSFERLWATQGPQDAEQDMYGQVAQGLEHADFAIMRAPRPTLLCTATGDFFDITGTWTSFREAKRVYTQLGFPERMDLMEAPGEHGLAKPQREAILRWMSRWLKGVDTVITEPDFAVLTPEQIQCSPEGQVMWMEGARSLFDVNMERESRLAAQREGFWKATPKADAISRVRELIVAKRYEEIASPAITEAGPLKVDGASIDRVLLKPEDGIVLPALVFRPSGAAKGWVIYCNGEGKAADAQPDGPIATLVREGNAVLAVDLRGIGETQAVEKSKDWGELIGKGWPDYFRAYQLRRSLVGMWAEDIYACVRYCAVQAPEDGPVNLVAVGGATVPALHAAALQDGLFASLTLRNGIPSWSEVVRTPNAKQQLMNTVHNALAFYDLPDLKSSMESTKVTEEGTKVETF